MLDRMRERSVSALDIAPDPTESKALDCCREGDEGDTGLQLISSYPAARFITTYAG